MDRDEATRRLEAEVGLLGGIVAEQRRALELSRVWWDPSSSPYHGGWHHGDCRCAACLARDAIRAALGEA
jgi:hypothetical protein